MPPRVPGPGAPGAAQQGLLGAGALQQYTGLPPAPCSWAGRAGRRAGGARGVQPQEPGGARCTGCRRPAQACPWPRPGAEPLGAQIPRSRPCSSATTGPTTSWARPLTMGWPWRAARQPRAACASRRQPHRAVLEAERHAGLGGGAILCAAGRRGAPGRQLPADSAQAPRGDGAGLAGGCDAPSRLARRHPLCRWAAALGLVADTTQAAGRCCPTGSACPRAPATWRHRSTAC